MMSNCKVLGCANSQIRAQGLCSKHYERLRVHGDVTVDKRSGSKKPKIPCSVYGCEKHGISRSMCAMHYGRWFRHGGTESKNPNYGSGRSIIWDGYVRIWMGTKHEKSHVMEHILVAERALERKLPKRAVVHHINGDKGDNRPENLVICPSQAYHLGLHKRQRKLGITFPRHNETRSDDE
jgi:hypothetical protein